MNLNDGPLLPDPATPGQAGSAGATSQAPAALLTGLLAQVQAGRHSPAAALDRIGWTTIEALARRAQALQGPAQVWLCQRLAARLAAWQTRHGHGDAAAQLADAAQQTSAATLPPPPSPLRALLAHVAGLADSANPGHPAHRAHDDAGAAGPTACSGGSGQPAADPHGAAAPSAPTHPGPAELKTLRQFRGSWQRLRSDQRLRSALATVPGQAGPLNSQHLLQRTLTQLQALSPTLLDHCLSYLDALAWLEDRTSAGLPGSGAAGSTPTATPLGAGEARPRRPKADRAKAQRHDKG